jgi:hypothetical protein
MPKRYNSSFTMFVYVNGHHLLDYYFAISDSRMSANDWDVVTRSSEVSALPREPRRRP